MTNFFNSLFFYLFIIHSIEHFWPRKDTVCLAKSVNISLYTYIHKNTGFSFVLGRFWRHCWTFLRFFFVELFQILSRCPHVTRFFKFVVWEGKKKGVFYLNVTVIRQGIWIENFTMFFYQKVVANNSPEKMVVSFFINFG